MQTPPCNTDSIYYWHWCHRHIPDQRSCRQWCIPHRALVQQNPRNSKERPPLQECSLSSWMGLCMGHICSSSALRLAITVTKNQTYRILVVFAPVDFVRAASSTLAGAAPAGAATRPPLGLTALLTMAPIPPCRFPSLRNSGWPRSWGLAKVDPTARAVVNKESDFIVLRCLTTLMCET